MQMTGKSRHKQRWPRVVGWIILSLLVVATSYGVYSFVTRDRNPIPKAMRNELTFSPFVIPKDSDQFTTTNYKFTAAEDEVKILTFVVRTDDNVNVSISEYPQPNEFAEIPDYKDRFLTNVANQYATVQTSNGTIYLGRMPKQSNRQLAVLLERGLIVFMTPDRELDDASWRQLSDHLDIQKISSD